MVRAGGQVHVTHGRARLQHGHGGVVGIQGHPVDFFLALGEFRVHGQGAGEVAGIAESRLGAGVQQEEVSGFQRVPMIVVVQGLTVLGGDDGKSQVAA